MKKISSLFIMLAVLLAGTNSVKAQERPINLGVSLGVSMHNVGGNVKKTSLRFGYDFAVTADYGLGKNFYIQSALEFKNKGFKAKHADASLIDPTMRDSKFWLNPLYFQVPIYAAYKIDVVPGTRIVFNAGPYFAVGVGGKAKFTDKINNWDKTIQKSAFNKQVGIKRFDVGLGFGAAAELSGLVLHLNYELGLNNVGRNGATIRNRNAIFSVGFKI